MRNIHKVDPFVLKAVHNYKREGYRKDIHQRGFSRAVLAQEPVNFTGSDIQRNIP
jgi:hypothetical protein